MFSIDFIKEFCKRENLSDISEKCHASQSSESKWSQPNDAEKVLKDSTREYANHTEIEKNPWLKIDLKKVMYPECLIIQNRDRSPFDEIASKIKVEYSTDEKNYQIIHSGEVYFGAFPNSIPLILPLKGKIALKYLKVSINSGEVKPLHLKRINILVPSIPPICSMAPKVTFYSSRNDGLGERLKSLLNAIVLADFYKEDFKFTWNKLEGLDNTHAITEASSIFSADFIQKFQVESTPEKLIELDKKVDFYAKDYSHHDSVKVSQNSIYKQVPALRNYISEDEFKKAFKKIEFSEQVNEAISLANNIELSEGAAAIHLRSGDIIYGRYRFSDRYTSKVISYAQADFILNKLTTQERSVVIFGQTESVCTYLAKKYDAIYPEEIEPYRSFNQLQKAFFDIVLMSRTCKTFSGSSGFAQLAELIGKTEIVPLMDYFDDKELYHYTSDILLSEETEVYDAFQTAFSHWHHYYSFKSMMKTREAITHLKYACELDSTNLFYKIVLSTLYFEHNNYEMTEKLISEILEARREERDRFSSYNYLKSYRYPDKSGALKSYQKRIKEMANSDIKNIHIIAKDFG